MDILCFLTLPHTSSLSEITRLAGGWLAWLLYHNPRDEANAVTGASGIFRGVDASACLLCVSFG
jgi:hypothetical protein